MTKSIYKYRGSCECGAVSLEYCCGQPLEQLTARACQCEYCLPRQASYLSDPAATLHVTYRDSRYVYAHRFATGSADFMHCAICNTAVYVKCTVAEQDYALVCAPVLEAYAELSRFEPVQYAAENLHQRLQRRSRNWIPELRVHSENKS